VKGQEIMAFRRVEKAFKLRKDKKGRPLPMWDEAAPAILQVDPDGLGSNLSDIEVPIWGWGDQVVSLSSNAPTFGPTASLGKAYSVPSVPGLWVVPGALTAAAQVSLARLCLAEFTQVPPNKSNLSNLAVRSGSTPPPPSVIPFLFAQQSFEPSQDINLPEAEAELESLRWVTLGYHYDWTHRRYDQNDHTPMPPAIANLARAFASVVGHSSYIAEAAIVNFYKSDSMLCGHNDDVELAQRKPIISVSLGCDCIFLVGPSRDVEPVALRLQSGDIMVMSGKSRSFVHGVPRILRDTFAPPMVETEDRVHAYLRTHRININVRQVFENPPEP